MQKEKLLSTKLEKIEKDVELIKSMLLWKSEGTKTIVSLRGALKGMQIGEKDVQEAKRALFRPNGE